MNSQGPVEPVRPGAAEHLVHRHVLQAFHQVADEASVYLRSPQVAAAWTKPSVLEELTVGGVVAHLYAAVRRLEIVLDEELPRPQVFTTLAGFYGVNRIDRPAGRRAGFHARLVEDAERRARHGHREVVERFAGSVGRLEHRLTDEDPSRLVPVVQVAGGVTYLVDYVRTRIVELVVHTDDLAASVRSAAVFPVSTTSVVVDVLIELARARVGDMDVVRAMTRSERSAADTLRVL